VVLFSPTVRKVEKWKQSRDSRKLIDALDAYDVEVHIAAIKAIHHLKLSEASTRLLTDLRHPLSSEIRRAAAEALGGMCVATSAEALITALGDDVPAVSKAAFEAVKSLGFVALKPLIESLKDYRNECVREMSLDALKSIGREAVPELIKGLQSGNTGLRTQCARLLGDYGGPQAHLALEEALSDTSPAVRKNAALSIQKLGIRPSKPLALAYYHVSMDNIEDACALGEVATPALKSELSHNNFSIRRRVAVCLRKVGWKPTTREEAVDFWVAAGRFTEAIKYGEYAQEPLMRMLADSNIKVKKGAAAALKKIGVPHAAKQMVRDIERMTDVTYFRLSKGTFDIRRIGLACHHYKGKLYLLSLENADKEQEQHILKLYPDAEIINEDEAI